MNIQGNSTDQVSIKPSLKHLLLNNVVIKTETFLAVRGCYHSNSKNVN